MPIGYKISDLDPVAGAPLDSFQFEILDSTEVLDADKNKRMTITQLAGAPIFASTFQVKSEKGVANGYASLDGDGLVPLSQLPNAALDLQAVTDIGAVTTNAIEANSFVVTSGLATEFLKADGTLDSNTYLTATGGNQFEIPIRDAAGNFAYDTGFKYESNILDVERIFVTADIPSNSSYGNIAIRPSTTDADGDIAAMSLSAGSSTRWWMSVRENLQSAVYANSLVFHRGASYDTISTNTPELILKGGTGIGIFRNPESGYMIDATGSNVRFTKTAASEFVLYLNAAASQASRIRHQQAGSTVWDVGLASGGNWTLYNVSLAYSPVYVETTTLDSRAAPRVVFQLDGSSNRIYMQSSTTTQSNLFFDVDGDDRFQLYSTTTQFAIRRTGTSASNLIQLTTSDTVQFHDGAYTFPNADGSADQVLSTDGAGNLSWANVAIPNGTAGQIPYMNGTADGFIFTNAPTVDSANGNLTVQGNVITDLIQGATYPSDSFLDFDYDETGIANSVALASIGSAVILIDTNNNGTNEIFGVYHDSPDVDVATALMILQVGSGAYFYQPASFSSTLSTGGALTVNDGALFVDRVGEAIPASLVLTGDAGYERRVLARTSTNSNRWDFGANATAEAAGNVGSDFYIRGWSNANTELGTYFTITRADGYATFFGNVGIKKNSGVIQMWDATETNGYTLVSNVNSTTDSGFSIRDISSNILVRVNAATDPQFGVGGVDPDVMLHVYGTNPMMKLEDSVDGVVARLGNANNFITGGTAGHFGLRAMTAFDFALGGTSVFKIDSNGHLISTISGDDARLRLETNSSSNQALIVLDATRSTSDNAVGQISFRNNDDSIASIIASRSGADDAGRLTLWTQTTLGTNTERLRIHPEGHMTAWGDSIRLQPTSLNAPYFRAENANQAVTTTDLGGFQWWVDDNSSGRVLELAANIKLMGGGTWNGSVSPSYLSFGIIDWQSKSIYHDDILTISNFTSTTLRGVGINGRALAHELEIRSPSTDGNPIVDIIGSAGEQASLQLTSDHVWILRNKGNEAGDPFVIRDNSAARDVIAIEQSTGLITFNELYAFPNAQASGANQVLVDVAGNGTLSWQSIDLDPTIDEVLANGNTTTRNIQMTGTSGYVSTENSNGGFRVRNGNITAADGVVDSLYFGQYGASTTQIRIVPVVSFDNEFMFGNDLSYDFSESKWIVDGNFEALDSIRIGADAQEIAGNLSVSHPTSGNFVTVTTYRNTTSPAGIAAYSFWGKNDNASPEDIQYARVYGGAATITDNIEDGELLLQVTEAGTLRTYLKLDAINTELVSEKGLNINAGNLVIDTMTFPNTDGSAGQHLKTDGAGTISWGNLAGQDIQWDNQELTNITKTGQIVMDANDASAQATLGDFAGTHPMGIWVSGDNALFATTVGNTGTVAVWHTGHFNGTNVANWETAYGWGDHSLAGYLTSADLATYGSSTLGSPNEVAYLNSSGDWAFSSNLTFTGGVNLNVGGDVYAADDIVAGSLTSGPIALTVNDGGGNANLTFNHRNEKAESSDTTQSAARITSPVDGITGRLDFSLANDTYNYYSGSGHANAGLDVPDTLVFRLETAEVHVYPILRADGGLQVSNAYTLPTGDGTANYVLQTNGSGTVSWQPMTGGSVGTLQQVTATGNTTNEGITITARSTEEDAHLALQMSPTNAYAAIRANGGFTNQTIHFFGDTWGTGETQSRGQINLSGDADFGYGVTFGQWSTPHMRVYQYTPSTDVVQVIIGDHGAMEDTQNASSTGRTLLKVRGHTSGSALIDLGASTSQYGYIYSDNNGIYLRGRDSRYVGIGTTSGGDNIRAYNGYAELRGDVRFYDAAETGYKTLQYKSTWGAGLGNDFVGFNGTRLYVDVNSAYGFRVAASSTLALNVATTTRVMEMNGMVHAVGNSGYTEPTGGAALTDVGVLLGDGMEVAFLTSGGYVRNLIKNIGERVIIGESGTSLINRIELRPGNVDAAGDGEVYVYTAGTNLTAIFDDSYGLWMYQNNASTPPRSGGVVSMYFAQTNYYYGHSNSSTIRWGEANNDNRFRGSLKIGADSTAAHELDVAGDAYASGFLRAGGGNYYGASESVRMYIGSTGAYHTSRLSVNQSSVNTSYAFYVNGTSFSSSDSGIGSDERTKEFVDNIPGIIPMLKKVEPYRYTKDGVVQLGYGAQSLKRIIKEPVLYDKSNDRFAISYAQMTAFNTKAIQAVLGYSEENRDRILVLEKEVKSLKQKLKNHGIAE